MPQPRGAPASRHHKRRQPLPTPRPDARTPKPPPLAKPPQNRKTATRTPRISQKKTKAPPKKNLPKPPPDSTPTPKSSSGRSTASTPLNGDIEANRSKAGDLPQPHRLARNSHQHHRRLHQDPRRRPAMRLALRQSPPRTPAPRSQHRRTQLHLLSKSFSEAYSRIRYLRGFPHGANAEPKTSAGG